MLEWICIANNEHKLSMSAARDCEVCMIVPLRNPAAKLITLKLDMPRYARNQDVLEHKKHANVVGRPGNNKHIPRSQALKLE